ncbi:MAG: BON domain-containing protein [Acidobacteriota bacterium]
MRLQNITSVRTLPVALLALLVVAGLTVSVPVRASDRNDSKATHVGLSEEIRHQLVMLPYFGVFDNLEFEIQDNNSVVLSGEVTRPILKSAAENSVRRLTGVGKIVDNIEVLPLSPFDDRIRVAEYRAIFSNGRLDRYVLRAVPPIHIVVKNGRVTLVGVVASQSDKNIAGIVANQVPGVFNVTNDLTVEK